jgi:formylmethanofuran dehydrogenase subunit E
MHPTKYIECSQCDMPSSEEDVFVVDNAPICRRCLFGEAEPFMIYPIGVVSNTQQRDKSDFGLNVHEHASRINLFASQKRFMYKLEEEERLTIIYYLHKSRPVRSRFKRGLDGKEVGVFASRTPDRLSRIGIQDVRLLEVKGTTLIVEGLDAIDGTPVMDIKLCWHRG